MERVKVNAQRDSTSPQTVRRGRRAIRCQVRIRNHHEQKEASGARRHQANSAVKGRDLLEGFDRGRHGDLLGQ